MRISHLEATNNCQLRCDYCPHWGKGSENIRRPIGDLSLEVVKKLIENKVFSKNNYLEFQLSGEPLLNPNFLEITKLLKSQGLLLGLSTNGILNSKFQSELEYIDYITISTHRPTVSLFNEIRELRKKKLVRVQVLDKDITVPKNIIDLLDYYPIEDYNRNKEYNQRGCSDFQRALVVQWDGDIVPCCRAHGKEYVLGNISKQSMKEILSSSRYKKLVDYHNKSINSSEIDKLCKYCYKKNNHIFLEKLQDEVRKWKRNL